MKGTLKVTKRLEAKVGLRVHALHGEGRPQTFALGWTTCRDGELRFFFFFFGGQWHKSRKEFIGSCKRTVCGQIWASGSAGPSYPQRLPGPPAAPLAPRPEALPGTVPCVCGNCPLRALLPFSFSFALLEAGRVLPFCRSGDCHRVRPHDDAHPCGPFPHLQDGGWGGGASRTVASVLAGP